MAGGGAGHDHHQPAGPVLLAVTGLLLGGLNATTLTLCGAIIFFFASAGASQGRTDEVVDRDLRRPEP